MTARGKLDALLDAFEDAIVAQRKGGRAADQEVARTLGDLRDAFALVDDALDAARVWRSMSEPPHGASASVEDYWRRLDVALTALDEEVDR